MTRAKFGGGVVVAVAVLVAALAVLLTPRNAEAHALLVRSDPQQNQQLPPERVPSLVSAYFSEGLDTHLSSLEVVDESGERVDAGETTFGPEPERMQIGLESTLEPGFYTVIWETLSSVDGHLFKGFYPFTVLNADGTLPPGQPFQGVDTGGTTAAPDTVLVRWARLLSIAAMVGSLAFFSLVVRPSLAEIEEPSRARWRDTARRRVVRVTLISAAALVAVAIGELYLQLDQVGGLDKLGDVLSNDWGLRFIQRQITLAVIVVAIGVVAYLWRNSRDRLADAGVVVALIGGAVYTLLIALVSHQDALPGAFWAVGADFLHILAASVWIGMLFQLAWFLLWLRNDIPPDARTDLQASHLQRFGVIAATSVVVLLATGFANAAAEFSDWSSLYDTAYGRSLLVKLGILGALLLAAATNAFYLRPRIIEEADEGRPADDLRQRMNVVVRIELALGIAVLCAAAVLVLYPTGRQIRDVEAFQAAATSAVIGYEETQPTGSGADDILIDYTASPGTVGQNSYRVYLFPLGSNGITTTPGEPGEILKVQLKFQHHTEDAGRATVDMEEVENLPTAYKAVGPYFSIAGQWDVDVVVFRRELDDVTATFPVPVEAPGAGGGQFEYPLTVGSWASVAAAVVLVLALIAATWVTEWPGMPQLAPRFVRVGVASLTVLGAGLLVLTLIPGDAQGDDNPIPPTSQSIAIGQQIYMRDCSRCHGINGDGNGPDAPTLTVKPADFRVHIPFHRDQFFFNAIQRGLGNIMPAWGGTLTEEQIWNLINFLHAEFGADAPASSSSPAPTPTPAASP